MIKGSKKNPASSAYILAGCGSMISPKVSLSDVREVYGCEEPLFCHARFDLHFKLKTRGEFTAYFQVYMYFSSNVTQTPLFPQDLLKNSRKNKQINSQKAKLEQKSLHKSNKQKNSAYSLTLHRFNRFFWRSTRKQPKRPMPREP